MPFLVCVDLLDLVREETGEREGGREGDIEGRKGGRKEEKRNK